MGTIKYLTIIAFLIALTLTMPAYAEDITILRNFIDGETDGGVPYGSLILDSETLYGMTLYGGEDGNGTIFSLGTEGTDFTLLHEFGGGDGDGAIPYDSLILFGGTLYGMTYYGGSGNNGTIFSIDTDGTDFTLLHAFAGGIDDGEDPYGSLVLDSDTLYGMTLHGGDYNGGTVFSIGTDGMDHTLLHEFAGGSTEGDDPRGSLALDPDPGILYGMTYGGGEYNEGTIFSLGTDGMDYTLLHAFAGNPDDGENPYGDLTLDLDSGTLYGMTSWGGAYDQGTIFSVGIDGTDYTLLHEFGGGLADGALPFGSLTLYAGTLYGMTSGGGDEGGGTIFSMKADGTDFALLYEFAGEPDGEEPQGSLVLDPILGMLYGMAQEGGEYDEGIIFSLAVQIEQEPEEPEEYVDLIKFDAIGDCLGKHKTAGTHTFEVEIESEFEYIQVTTKAGKAEAVTQIAVGDDPVTDALGFVVQLVSVADGVYIVEVSSTDQTPKALSYVILGAGKMTDGDDPVLVDYEETEGYVVETGDNLHANCFKDTPAGPKGVEATSSAAAPQGPSQEVLDKKAALEEQKALAADARFARKQAHMLDIFGEDYDGMPLKGPR
jgi:uncharacterized repeat protein (TIGR03803 family)